MSIFRRSREIVPAPGPGQYDLVLYTDGQKGTVLPVVIMNGNAYIPPAPSSWTETLITSDSAYGVIQRARYVYVVSIEELEAEYIMSQHGIQ